MAIPVNSNTGVGESLVAAVERDVVINLTLVVLRVLLRARHSRLFVRSEQKDQIAFRFYLRDVEGADSREQCFDVTRVVANPRSIDATITNRGFDFKTRLKDRVHMSVEHRDWTTADSFTGRDQVAGRVVANLQLIFAQQTFDKPGALLFLF